MSLKYFWPFDLLVSSLNATISWAISTLSISSIRPSAPVFILKNTGMSYSSILKYSSSDRTLPILKLFMSFDKASSISSNFLFSASSLSSSLAIFCLLASSASCFISSFCSPPVFACLDPFSFSAASLSISFLCASNSFLTSCFLPSIVLASSPRDFFLSSSFRSVTR